MLLAAEVGVSRLESSFVREVGTGKGSSVFPLLAGRFCATYRPPRRGDLVCPGAACPAAGFAGKRELPLREKNHLSSPEESGAAARDLGSLKQRPQDAGRCLGGMSPASRRRELSGSEENRLGHLPRSSPGPLPSRTCNQQSVAQASCPGAGPARSGPAALRAQGVS